MKAMTNIKVELQEITDCWVVHIANGAAPTYSESASTKLEALQRGYYFFKTEMENEQAIFFPKRVNTNCDAIELDDHSHSVDRPLPTGDK